MKENDVVKDEDENCKDRKAGCRDVAACADARTALPFSRGSVSSTMISTSRIFRANEWDGERALVSV